MRYLFACLAALLVLCVTARCRADCTYYPPNGFVPNATTAVSIAKAVAIPLYGAESVKAKAFTATLSKGIWTVYGWPTNKTGDAAIITISKKSGAILEIAIATIGHRQTPTKGRA